MIPDIIVWRVIVGRRCCAVFVKVSNEVWRCKKVSGGGSFIPGNSRGGMDVISRCHAS